MAPGQESVISSAGSWLEEYSLFQLPGQAAWTTIRLLPLKRPGQQSSLGGVRILPDLQRQFLAQVEVDLI